MGSTPPKLVCDNASISLGRLSGLFGASLRSADAYQRITFDLFCASANKCPIRSGMGSQGEGDGPDAARANAVVTANSFIEQFCTIRRAANQAAANERDLRTEQPTFDQAVRAGMAISNFYGRMELAQPVERETISDSDAVERLSDLAQGVNDGTITSHGEIARVVQGISPKMGPMGSASHEIDVAAFQLHKAVIAKQKTFTDKD